MPCEHGLVKQKCRDCSPHLFCEHDRVRYYCVPCKGGGICEHQRKRYDCVECGGKGICEHQKRRTDCKECGGSQRCEHGRIKQSCKECGGACVCEHNRMRSLCKICKGGGICEHNMYRTRCKICGGGSLCEHGIERTRCKECGGGSLCEHGKEKCYCKLCDGSQICEHNIYKGGCVFCNPKIACENCKLVNIKRSKYKPYCFKCYCILNPDAKIPKMYKLREHYLIDGLTEHFKDLKFVFDKPIHGGCSKYRPDILIDCLTHSIVIECDEEQHERREYTCENKRTMTLFRDLGNRPAVLIRFNPDSYTDKNGVKVESCFKLTPKLQQQSIFKKEWGKRLKVVIDTVEKYLSNVPEKELTVEHLFYDE